MPGILILGAGFGGLELSTLLSEALGDDAGVTLIDSGDAFVFGYSKLDVMFGRATLDEVRLPYARGGQAGRAPAPRDGHRDRSRGAAGDDGPRRPRGRRARRRARRRLRLRRHARAARARATSSTRSPAPHGCARCCPTFSQRPRARRRLRGAVQVPARAERGGAAAARRAVAARRPRRLRDHARDAASGRRCRPRPTPRPRCSTRSRSAGSSSSPAAASARSTAAAWPCSRTAASCRSTSSSACRSTARPMSCSRAGWPWTATCRSTRAPSRRASTGVYAVGDVATVGVPKAGVFSERQARVVAAAIVARSRGEGSPDALRRARLLLHRVRGGPRRPGRRRLLLGPEADRDAPGAVRGARRREDSSSARAAARAGSAASRGQKPSTASDSAAWSSTRREIISSRTSLSVSFRAARGVPGGISTAS